MSNLVPILLYHSVTDQGPRSFARWSVFPQVFEAHLRYLRDAGYHSYTITELIAYRSRGYLDTNRKPVAITFDDGLADFYTYALPILSKYNMKATLYLVTGYIGGNSHWLKEADSKNQPMMSWDQVRLLFDHGIECGAHSHSHHPMDILPPALAEQEIIQSKKILEDQLSRPVHSFAYPHGYYNQEVRGIVQNTGFTSACAVKNAISSTEDDPFALARITVYSNTIMDSFRQILEGRDMPVAPFPERLRTKAWRQVRRLWARVSNRSWS